MSLKAIFPAGITELTVNGLHQWDYGRKLEIHATDLPALVEVHFACPGMDEATVRVSSAVGGVATVAIPDRCLEQSSPVTAWVYEVGETSGQTIKTLTLNVKARTRPQAGGEITPELSDKYTEAVEAMNETIARMPEQFLEKKGGRISGRLFVDGDLMEVGGARSTHTFTGVSYLEGNSDVQGSNIVHTFGLFGNGSRANGVENGESDPSKWGIRGLYDKQVGNVIEIGKDNKVKFNGKAESAKEADLAKEVDLAIKAYDTKVWIVSTLEGLKQMISGNPSSCIGISLQTKKEDVTGIIIPTTTGEVYIPNWAYGTLTVDESRSAALNLTTYTGEVFHLWYNGTTDEWVKGIISANNATNDGNGQRIDTTYGNFATEGTTWQKSNEPVPQLQKGCVYLLNCDWQNSSNLYMHHSTIVYFEGNEISYILDYRMWGTLFDYSFVEIARLKIDSSGTPSVCVERRNNSIAEEPLETMENTIVRIKCKKIWG